MQDYSPNVKGIPYAVVAQLWKEATEIAKNSTSLLVVTAPIAFERLIAEWRIRNP